MRLAVLAAAGFALLLAPPPAVGQGDAPGGAGAGAGAPSPEAAPPPQPPATPPAGRAGLPLDPAPIRPILLVGLGGGGGGFAVAADAGIRIAPVLAWLAYRGVGMDGGLLSYASGRVGWILAERSWIAAYAAAGGGKLRYVYNVAPGSGSAGVVAFSAELGVHLFPRAFAGPALALSVEALAPLPRTSDPRNGLLSAPAVMVLVDVNVLYLLARPFVW